MLPILHQSYWRDEAFSVLLSSKGLWDIVLLATKDTSPPLYYLILHFWIRMFGDAEYITRSLSLSFHLLLGVSTYFLIQYFVKSWKLSSIGSLIVLLNPFLMEYAFEVRGYSLFALLIVTATNFFLRKKYFLSSLSLTFALLTHNFAIFFLFAFGVGWLYRERGTLLSSYISAIKQFLLPLITLGAWSTFLWNQWTKVADYFWITPQDSSIFVDAFRAYFLGSTDYSLKGMIYNLAIFLVSLGIFRIVYQHIQGDENSLDRDRAVVFILFVIPLLVVYSISAYWVPIFHERYMIPILPLFIAWIATLLFELAKLKVSLSHLVFALAITYLAFLVQGSEEIVRKTIKPAINYGVQQVVTQMQEGDIIIPKSELNFLEIKYYVNKLRPGTTVLARIPEGRPVFYIGAVLFEDNEVVTEYPEDKRIWIVENNGANYLLTD